MKKRTIALESICFLFILLFTYAAAAKLLDYQKFVVQIGKSPLLTGYAGILAWAVPAIELIIVAILITKYRLIGLYASFATMVIFSAYIVAILQLKKADIPCSCGGILDSLGWTEHLIFNVVFVILALVGIILYEPNKKSDLHKNEASFEKGKAKGDYAEAGQFKF